MRADGDALSARCAATLVDMVGSAALATVANRTGVSVHISTEYLAALPIGDTAVVHGTVMSKGNRIGIVEVRRRASWPGCATLATLAAALYGRARYSDAPATVAHISVCLRFVRHRCAIHVADVRSPTSVPSCCAISDASQCLCARWCR